MKTKNIFYATENNVVEKCKNHCLDWTSFVCTYAARLNTVKK